MKPGTSEVHLRCALLRPCLEAWAGEHEARCTGVLLGGSPRSHLESCAAKAPGGWLSLSENSPPAAEGGSVRRSILAATIAAMCWGVLETANAQQANSSLEQPLFESYAFQQPLAGSYVPRQPLTGSHALQQPLAGSYALQQPLAGSYALQQPLAGSYTLQQPLAGSYALQQPLAGSYALQQPLVGSYSLQQSQVGGYFLQQPLMEGYSLQRPGQK
jgi:hypothetical protein